MSLAGFFVSDAEAAAALDGAVDYQAILTQVP
jgi:hypothetical protein